MHDPRGPAPVFNAPEPLSPHHDPARFRNGRHPSLDDWLKTRARKAEGVSARTYVVTPRDEPARVVGYYALSTHQLRVDALPTAKLRRNLPDPVPTILLGRLAVDLDYSGKGLGSALLASALKRSAEAARAIGVRAVVTHAIDLAAADFYRRHGFIESVSDSATLLMPVESVWKIAF